MTPLGQLTRSIKPLGDGRWSVTASDDWRQGRTLYGGISAALCYEACQALVSDLPPLRSAQIAFIGPSAGEAELIPTILRRGKSVSYLSCDLNSEGALATRALFAFGGERPSAFDIEAAAPPIARDPADSAPLFAKQFPAFAAHFDMRLAAGDRPVTGAKSGDMLVWTRYRDADLPDGLSPLVAMADALPPASMPRLASPAAISSMTWQFDLADADRFQPDQWTLMRAQDEAVRHGYSGQSMAMWDASGRPILIGRQAIAIFA